MTKYIISKSTTIELNEKNEIRTEDIDITLLASLGFEPENVEGVTVWLNKNDRFWLLNEQNLPNDDAEREKAIAAINQMTNAQPLSPALDLSFSQVLMRQIPMNVTGEAFVSGSLTGQWRAETITLHNPYDVNAHGILAGKMQPMSFAHPSLSVAVAILFLQALGVGQRAYVYIPDRAESQPQLLYVTAQNEKGLKDLVPEICLYRMENLDKYAVIGLDQDMVQDACEKAQLQRTILLAKAKTNAPQPEPELVAAAPAAEPQKAE